MSQDTQLTEDEAEATAVLHDHVYDMFFAQNAIIDMDSRHEITDLRFSGDDFTKTLIHDYATKIEEFLKYAADNPEKIARSLEILKG
jgi:hypothetical protein